MAIDKSLNQAPLGLEDLVGMEPDIEIEIEDPESVEIRAGGIEIEIGKGGGTGIKDFTTNLADHLDEGVLDTLADELIDDFTQDKDSRKEWEKTYRDGLKLLGLKIEERTEPWPGSCGVFHPLLSEAVVRFQADAIMETFPAKGPVKTQIIGKLTKEKEQAAIRVRDDMNYQLTVKMPEYRAEHERMLWSLALAGSAFKKVYFDPNLGRQVSVFVPAEDFVISYGATDLQTCGRYTHVMRKSQNDVKKLQVARFYREADLPEPSEIPDEFSDIRDEQDEATLVQDDRYLLLEMHVDLIIEDDPLKDKDGIALPYVVTIERGSSTILSVRRNWNPDDDLRQKRLHFIHYTYIPGFGFYGFGLIHLIGGHAKSSTSLLRQLVDAGTLSNLPGGLKTRGLRIKGDDTPIQPGEFRDVDIASGKIAENIAFLPYKEPSQTLLALMDNIVAQGRSLAAVAELKIDDVSKDTPVGTTLALLERSLKVMSAVQARLHAAMRSEFQLLAAIIAEFVPDTYEYEPKGEGVDPFERPSREDYDIVEIIPVSDPNASTFSQRVIQYQAALQLAQSAPQLYDMGQLHRQMLEVIGMRDIQKILPLAEDMKPVDPVSENMNILNMKPVKAFLYQDHAAHIQTHMNLMQDPQLQQVMGQNPQAQVMMAAAQAHIAEHMAFAYRQRIEQVLGAPLPPPDTPLPEDMEVEMSRIAAQASSVVLGQSQQEVAAQQAQQAQNDPVVQMQQQELQIKQAEQQRKQQKDILDAAAKADQLAVERERIQVQAQTDGARIGLEAAKAKNQQQVEETKQGIELGLKMGEVMSQQAQQQTQRNQPKETE
jgi:hypothetical protein